MVENSDNVSARKPEDLVEKLQREVNNSVNWLKDSRLYVASDTSKLLIVGTEQLKRTTLKKRVGTLKRLAKFMSKKKLSMLSGGIFYAK